MNEKGQAYTLDALVALIILAVGLVVCVSLASVNPVRLESPVSAERVLGQLLLCYDLQNAIYLGDVKAIRAHLESVLPKGARYYLAVYDENWAKLYEIGVDFEGVTAVAQLLGVNGTFQIRYVVLKVRV